MRKDRGTERKDPIVSQGDFLIERHIATAMSAAHWHDHVEINLLLEGQMTYLFNGRQEQVEAGRFVLFWAAIPHQTIAVTPDAPLVCIYLPLVDFLALPIDRDIRQSIMQGRFLAETSLPLADMILVPQWVEEWQDCDGIRRQLIADEVKLRVRRLVLDTAAEQISQPPAPPVGPTVRRAELLTNLISLHYGKSLSVPALARLAGMHASTANKVFRDVLGLSVNEYLTRYRLARAMQRLADTDDPIVQIGYDCGFGSSSRFYDVFRRRTGTTPKLFRSSLVRPDDARWRGPSPPISDRVSAW